jgi:hypothetical protein
MATRELDIVDLDHAFSARLATSLFLTRVIAIIRKTFAGLLALECSVHSFRMASGPAAVTAVKAVYACLSTPSFGAEFGKIIWILNIYDFAGVAWATQAQRLSNRVLCT